MSKNISSLRIIRNIFKSIFKWAPFSGSVTVLNYICEALIPAAVTAVSAGLFDSAAKVLSGRDAIGSLWTYAVLYLVFYLINDLLSFFFSIAVNAGVYEKGTHFFRIALYEKMSRLPLISFEDAEILNQKERAEKAVNDETLSAIFNRCLIFLKSAVSIIAVMLVLINYSLWLIPVCLLSVLPYLISRLIRGKEFFYVKRAQAKRTRLQGYLWGLFNDRRSAKEMRVMGFDSYLTDKWKTVRDGINEELWEQDKKDSKLLLFCDSLRIAGYGISIVIAMILTIRGEISAGVFGACIAAFLSMQNGMRDFLYDLGSIPEKLSFAGDYYKFLALPEEIKGSGNYPGLKFRIELKNVYFSYPNHKNKALDDVTLSIKKGEKIAIVGENGSGKTTLSKVILGLYPLNSGHVLYDGIPVSEIDPSCLLDTVSVVAQNFVPYNLTLRENIAISDISKLECDALIEKTLEESGLSGILDEVGIDGPTGREFDGGELSGGQWQKLAIARGLFKDSELIILDEPTSALDPLIETEILSRFIDMAARKTAIIISHRVGLCRLVDKIVVMRDGKIAEAGTHSELMASNGEYHRLFTAQEKWYD